MKRMLFNATQAEELRVAIVDGQKLIDLDIESAAKEQRKSNIYKAVITRIEPSLEAAFVEYGADRHGFLPFKEVSRSYFKPGVDVGKARIQDALSVGQEIIVQVEKDERGNKGAALTTYISLAGRYLVLMPNNPRGGGVSRRIEGEDRQELREVMDQLEVPSGTSLIARTAGIGRSLEELQWDLNYLQQLWTAIDSAAKAQSGVFLIYQESSLVIRAIRDYFHAEIGEILIDTDDVFEQAQQFMAHVMPGNVSRVKRYQDDVPLFSRFQIEHQIESAYSRQVTLPSGGAIVIDHTEALVSVDVNSGRATKGSDIEETAFRTNCEAADEIARQLRLRDLGGLIVIDFIDMESAKNQREVENRLRDALHHDRARVQTGKISRFGLLELSRQRLRPALAEASYITCPRCTGTGHIRSTESAALHILRIIEEESMKENTGALHCQVPVDVGTFLLNEKRIDIAHIESRHRVNLVIIPNRHLETPAHEIVRVRHDQLNSETSAPVASYQMASMPVDEAYQTPSAQADTKPAKIEAAVRGITSGQPAPIVTPPSNAAPAASAGGFFSKIAAFFFGDKKIEEPATKTSTSTQRSRTNGSRGRDGGRERNRNPRHAGQDGGERERKNRPQAQREEEQNGSANPNQRAREKPSLPKEAREPREPRQPRPPRAVAGEIQATATQETGFSETDPNLRGVAPAPTFDAENNLSTATETTPRSGRRSRGRGRGRGRGERNDAESMSATVPADSTDVVLTVDEASYMPRVEEMTPPVAIERSTEPSPYADIITTQTMPLPVPMPELVVDHQLPVVMADVPVDAPVYVPVDAPIEQPSVADIPAPVESVQVAPAAEPPPPQPASPIDLSSTLQQAGLIMIQTASSPATPPDTAAMPPQPLGRKPKPAAMITDEPLQMVETKNK